MHEAAVPLTSRRFGQTSRRDRWWVQPALVAAGLSAFIVYATWAAFQGTHYHWGPYLSPFYSPEIFGESAHSWLGPKPDWWASWLPWSPAFLILWAPGGFRMICYYYRGAYYKAFWALEMHSLDTADRTEALRRDHGIGYCNITKCCTSVCPEQITITDNAIIPLKERVVDEFYDPLRNLVNRLIWHGSARTPKE